MTKHIYRDVVIAGCGAVGLYTVLNLPEDLYILMTCREDTDTCDSMLVQGGVCVPRGEDDCESYFGDTMKTGHYGNRRESADLMIRTSPGIIRHLLELGVGLDRSPDGNLRYTKGGIHSRPRICSHKNIIGKAITTVLREWTAAFPNVDIVEYTVMINILTANGAYAGIQARTRGNSSLFIHVRDTVMATRDIGGLCQHSTNSPCLTGDALVVAQKHGVKLGHLDYVQIHPTGLYMERPGRSFLVSESARGGEAMPLNGKGERFVNELLPRDAASQSIEAEMEEKGSCHAWLSLAPIPQKIILEHFPHMYETCLEEGCNITKEPISMVPIRHYFMGGAWVDLDSRTSMEYLYAVDETSYSGVHGKSRLANSSLLENLVFAGKAAKGIENSQKGRIHYKSNCHAAYY